MAQGRAIAFFMNFSSFSAPATAVVIGASGGIGSAIRQHLEDSPVFANVIAFGRPSFDLKNEDSIREAAVSIDQPIDLVFVATGVLHTDSYQPEKALRQIDPATMQDVFAINTVGPSLVAKHFLPKMRKDAKSVFAALSARVGSISDNRLGGWVSYRASKAALNMALKNISIEWRRSLPNVCVASLHPGTTDSGLSKPFQKNVRPDKLFPPEKTASLLLDVIEGLDAEKSGGFWSWDRELLPW